MSELSFEAVSHGQLASVSGFLDAGMNVLLGTERDGTAEVVQLAAGVVAPARGRILLEGRAPFFEASVRQRIGALLAEEQLPSGRNVRAALELALHAREDTRSVLSVLDSAGLAHLAARRPSGTSAREKRALGLALALSHPRPSLLALHEPLSLLDMLPERLVLEGLAHFAGAGAVLLVTTVHLEHAVRLGGEMHALERGIWLGSARARTPLAPATLRVETTEPARLAALLVSTPDISGTSAAGATELLVHGLALERIASQVVSSARAASLRISALREDAPTLQVLPAARGEIARAFSNPGAT